MPRLPLLLAVSGLALSCATSQAAVITDSPTLPVLNFPYAISGAGSCFPAANICAVPGTLTMTSVVPSPPAPPPFNGMGQDIVAEATLTATIMVGGGPALPLTLTGQIEFEVLGRTFSDETGSWATEVTALDLSGPVQGHTLSMSLDSSSPSTGSASVEPDTQHPGRFIVDSFFDVFVDLTLDTPIPLQTTREAQLQLTAPSAVPEPASAGLLCGALLCLGAVRRSHFRRNHRSLGCETAI